MKLGVRDGRMSNLNNCDSFTMRSDSIVFRCKISEHTNRRARCFTIQSRGGMFTICPLSSIGFQRTTLLLCQK